MFTSSLSRPLYAAGECNLLRWLHKPMLDLVMVFPRAGEETQILFTIQLHAFMGRASF
jgi:hypothetical protein